MLVTEVRQHSLGHADAQVEFRLPPPKERLWPLPRLKLTSFSVFCTTGRGVKRIRGAGGPKLKIGQVDIEDTSAMLTPHEMHLETKVLRCMCASWNSGPI